METRYGRSGSGGGIISVAIAVLILVFYLALDLGEQLTSTFVKRSRRRVGMEETRQ